MLPALTEDVMVKYAPGPVIGQGAYGIVISAVERSTRKRLACKVVVMPRLLATPDGPNVATRLRNEISVMAYLAGHPNIVRMVDVLESTDRIFIVQELCTGGTLGHVHIPVDEARAARLFRGIAKAVLHCHQRGVLHRDIKLDNFMLSENTVKLGDFGFAHFVGRDEKLTDAVGSPFFMAPETITKAGYGFESDVWSCGVCLFRLLSAEFPFKGKTSSDVFAAVRHTRSTSLFAGPEWNGVSPDAKHLVRHLLTKDPLHRMGLEAALSHPWMQRHARAASFSEASPVACKASARIFLAPADTAERARVDGFVDCFTREVERPYNRLLAAPNADDAATAWRAVCDGLRLLNAFMEREPCENTGAYVLCGGGPSLAEAATSPSLYRMSATLAAVRGLDLLKEAEGMGVASVARWMAHVLSHPGECCDVAELPSDVYVHLARRIVVTYDGPPSMSFNGEP